MLIDNDAICGSLRFHSSSLTDVYFSRNILSSGHFTVVDQIWKDVHFYLCITSYREKLMTKIHIFKVNLSLQIFLFIDPCHRRMKFQSEASKFENLTARHGIVLFTSLADCQLNKTHYVMRFNLHIFCGVHVT